MTEPRHVRASSRQLAAVVIVWAIAVVAPVASSAGAAPGPASNPSRNTTMATNDATGAFTVVQLKDLVGDRIGPWTQTGLDVPLASSALPQPATLVYGFRHGKQKATLTVSDAGAVNSAPGPSHWTGPPNRRKTDAGDEFVYREGRHTVREIERRQPPAREVVLLLANGIVVTAAGDADMKALKALASGLPIDTAESLVRPAN